jgi:glucan phosphoethanolaminetransferase (alkaline phosphatase superfamily)
MVSDIVKNSEGNFIWINKMGVHFPYEKNYPEDGVSWLPTDRTAEKSELTDNNQPLINNYDNAIKYNLDAFFENLLSGGVPHNTVFVYTSDHGQTLIQGKASHCGSTRDEAMVPLFIIAQPEMLPPADTDFRASHANIFASLLDLMKYPEEERRYDYSISLFKAKREDSAPRYYFSGPLTGASGGGLHLYDD